jgi:hypothetical protein
MIYYTTPAMCYAKNISDDTFYFINSTFKS